MTRWTAPRPIYPLCAPGMPLPGPDFLDLAQRHGDTSRLVGKGKKAHLDPGPRLSHYVSMALMRPWSQFPINDGKGQVRETPFVPGHRWGEDLQRFLRNDKSSVSGPQRADVMVIGKMPGKEEVEECRCWVGKSGKYLLEALRRAGFEDVTDWYVTNLVKFMPPDGSDKLQQRWVRECLPLLHQELRLVRPRFILCLGTDASQAIFGKGAKVDSMDGRVLEYGIPLHTHEDDEPEIHQALVMVCSHPARVLKDLAQQKAFERALSRFRQLLHGTRWDQAEEDLDHRLIESMDQLDDVLTEADRDCPDRMIAVDAEWHGARPGEPGSWLRTIQFSWKHKTAACIVLRRCGGKFAFKMATLRRNGKKFHERDVCRAVADRLVEFFADKRVVGHFFSADFPWLKHFGLDLTHQYRVPLLAQDGTPAWRRTQQEGGADTAIMAHAVEETAPLGLESLTVRYTDMPRYDTELQEWLGRQTVEDPVTGKRRKVKKGELEGFGDVPDDMLHGYALKDADAARRIWVTLDRLLDHDGLGLNCRPAFWEGMLAMQGILEIEETGLLIDRERVEALTDVFVKARDSKEAVLRDWSGWDVEGNRFNLRSPYQVREFLFGEEYSGYKTGKQRRRPDGARSLHLPPTLNTTKPQRRWSEIAERGEEHENTPSTDKLATAVLMLEQPEFAGQVKWLQQHRFLDQVVKQVLKPPASDPGGGWAIDEDTGQPLYQGGMGKFIAFDGRVHGHFSPTAETARFKAWDPNLQNLAGSREDTYREILGPDYLFPIRSMFVASPGCILVEADYKSAELLGMALMAQDDLMIEHAQRGVYPEGDPRHYDIHSEVARSAFKIAAGVKPTKLQRFMAKRVSFGKAYGQTPPAIVLAAAQLGVQLPLEDALACDAVISERYSRLDPFYEQAAQRAHVGWGTNCWQRHRRFPVASGKDLKDMEREAKNFYIQSLVAGLVNRALARLQHWRDNVLQDPGMFRIVLQLHDALMFEVPLQHVERFIREALPFGMTHVPVYATDLEGNRMAGPYYFASELKIMERFGMPVDKERAAELGLPDPKTVEIVMPKRIG